MSLAFKMRVIGCRRRPARTSMDDEAGVTRRHSRTSQEPGDRHRRHPPHHTSLPSLHVQVTDIFAIEDLGNFLSQCDYVVSVLPSTPQTRGLLAGDALSPCAARRPVLINVGRGDLIPDEAIVHALDQNWISHYVGDVFVPEPLPTSSPLWSHPKVTVTPHISAVTQPSDVADAFGSNLARFERDGTASLSHVFDWEAGY